MDLQQNNQYNGENNKITQSSTETTAPLQNPFYKSKKILAIIVLFILIIITTTLFFYLNKKQNNGNSAADKAIVKVGKEYIYQKDLDYELSQYPSIPGVDAKKVVLKKLIDNSIAIQSFSAMQQTNSTATDPAQKSNITPAKENFVTTPITIDTTVFNTPNKDYAKRIQIIDQIKAQYEEKQKNIKGSIVAIWFFNVKPGVVGYDQGKAISYAKISKLHEEVTTGKITMKEAGEEIIKDSSLAQVDIAYKANAFLTFNAGSTDSITYDPAFDLRLRKLKTGEITDVYLGKDLDSSTNQQIDAIYMFGQVDSVSNVSTSNEKFADWITNQEQHYEIVYY